MRVFQVIAVVALLTILGCVTTVAARSAVAPEDNKSYNQQSAVVTANNITAHRVGHIGLAITNTGTFGNHQYPGALTDCFTGDPINFGCEYPRGSGADYLSTGALWIGAPVGRDTLVSVGADGWSSSGEMYPDEPPFGNMVKRSTIDPSSPLYWGAVSHEDYVGVYMDTSWDLLPRDYFGRPAYPLDVRVTQSSFAWSYAWTEDFVLIDYQIKNIGQEALTETYIGFYVDADICFDCNGPTQGFADDLSGFLQTYPTQVGQCEFLDTINIAWSADNDGDFSAPVPAPHVTGLAPLGEQADDIRYNFNWWVSNGNSALDFGPRLKGTAEYPMRDFRTGGLGTPEGDVNKYYMMMHPEFDYDQAYTASISPTDTLWLYPNQTTAGDFADGYDTRYLLSFGPFDILPGQTLPITMAYVAGENLHTNAANIQNLPDHPDVYYSNLDFSDLANNAKWAGWVYDNPGIDTDGDGYFGKFRICCDGDVCDTIWYEGDGVPDFSAVPSMAGQDMVWVEPREEALWVRWNGRHAELQEDMLTGQVDFEGYRIYLSPDGTPGSYAEVESYDIEDYLKYSYSQQWGWELRDYPFTPEELRCLYGASCDDLEFDPLSYTVSNPYIVPGFPDSILRFEAFDLNKSQFGVNTQILKRFPGQPYPSSLDTSLVDPSELTSDGTLKYFEYELTIRNLLAGECYWVNVTRTDFGAPQFGLPGDESDLIESHPIGCTPPPQPGFRYHAGWNLVSAPVDLESPLPADIFGGSLPFWQLYGWNGSGYYNPTEVDGCGEGYWLFAPEPAIVDYQGADCPPSGTIYGTICVQADSGWNLIGSPAHDTLFLGTAYFQAQGETVGYADALTRGWIARWMYYWAGTGYGHTLDFFPGEGCWFASMIDDLEICLRWSPGAPRREPVHDLLAASGEHTMTISLVGTSEAVQIGVDEEATADFDSKFDMPSPPAAPGATASLVILSESDTMWNRLKTDIRPLNNELFWDLMVTSNSTAKLEFADVATVTTLGYSITLINSHSQNILAAITDDQTVRVNPGRYSIVASRSGETPGEIPSAYVLADNYPNPFNPSTTIKFGLPTSGQVRLAIYNLLGQEVAIIVDEVKTAGWHEVSWNGRNDQGSGVSSGVYFYRLETGEFVESRKMLLIK